MRRWLLILCLFALLPSSPALGESGPLTVRLLVSNPLPYQGEAVILSLELEYAGQPRGMLEAVWPDLSPFLSQDLPDLPPQYLRQAGHSLYRQTLRKRLIPLTGGRFTLSGAIRHRQQLHPAPALTLRVAPLPESGRPEGFSGAVGELSMAVEMAGRGTREVQLTLDSSGGLSQLPAPLAQPGANERLVKLQDISTTADDGSERRRLRYLYFPGEAEPGELSFSYNWFSPRQQRYLGQELPRTAESTSRPLLLSLPLLCGGTLFLLYRDRRRSDLELILSRLSGLQPNVHSQTQLLNRLHVLPLPAELLAELEEIWRQEALAYAPGGPFLPDGLARRRRRLARRLHRLSSKSIDKAPEIP